VQLIIQETAADHVRVGYRCPCGCQPSVSFQRGAEGADEGCCCGNEFSVASHQSPALEEREGFRRETELFLAPWGEQLMAQWLVGASVHPDEPSTGPTSAIDPVCGMTVDVPSAEGRGLHSRYQGIDYWFCGKGCKLDFDEEPDRFLDPSYQPSM
jgi:YHS domain-containing protein